jgi:hypothetical protein
LIAQAAKILSRCQSRYLRAGGLASSGRSAFAHTVRLDAIELIITDQLPEPKLRMRWPRVRYRLWTLRLISTVRYRGGAASSPSRTYWRQTRHGSEIAAGSAYPVPTAAAHASLIPDGTSLGEKGTDRWNLVSHP